MIQSPEEQDEFYDEEEFEEEEQASKKSAAAPAWLISILVHALLICSLLYILMPKEDKIKDAVITTTPIPPEEEEKEEEKEIDVVKEKVEVEVEVEVETPPVVTEEVVEDHNETENEMEAQTAEGVSEAISDMPLVGSGVMGNIGGGGGGGGAFGQRNGGGKKRAVLKGGGSKKTESAVDGALWWLAHHQEPDGHWDTAKYGGDGKPEVFDASTGAALLAFLGAGHTDRVGKWKGNVKRAIRYLLSVQKPDGSFARLNYTNGICTMALAEAMGMGCGGSDLKKATGRAVDYILKQQNVTGAYNYHGPSARNDMSVTGWCIMALKSAMISGIKEKEIKEVFKKFGHYMDEQKTTTGDNTSETKGDSWYQAGNNKFSKSSASTACAAIAMLMRQYLGWHRAEPWLEASSDGLIKFIPKRFQGMNIYKVYYAYLSLFQQGGDNWKTWNKQVTKIVLEGQRQDGDFKGSWDSSGHVKKGGRVLSTALLCLSLEVYYRYKSVMH